MSRTRTYPGCPSIIFTDRGKGFHTPNSGKITNEYQTALRDHNLTAFMGNDASEQPGNLQEVMLHETLVAWTRKRLERTMPKKPWEESIADFGERLRKAYVEINRDCDVQSLCEEFPSRVQRILDESGGRISK